MTTASHPKILLFAEGATLAHVARPYMLACSLDPGRFDITFAPQAFPGSLRPPLPQVDLLCQDTTNFARRLESGLPVYNFPTLLAYAKHDLAPIESARPNLIIGLAVN